MGDISRNLPTVFSSKGRALTGWDRNESPLAQFCFTRERKRVAGGSLEEKMEVF